MVGYPLVVTRLWGAGICLGKVCFLFVFQCRGKSRQELWDHGKWFAPPFLGYFSGDKNNYEIFFDYQEIKSTSQKLKVTTTFSSDKFQVEKLPLILFSKTFSQKIPKKICYLFCFCSNVNILSFNDALIFPLFHGTKSK